MDGPGGREGRGRKVLVVAVKGVAASRFRGACEASAIAYWTSYLYVCWSKKAIWDVSLYQNDFAGQVLVVSRVCYQVQIKFSGPARTASSPSRFSSSSKLDQRIHVRRGGTLPSTYLRPPLRSIDLQLSRIDFHSRLPSQSKRLWHTEVTA